MVIIPARGNSKRLPRKNILPFKGRPIIHYPIMAARGLERVIVSTENEEIAEIALNLGVEVHKRPPELAQDNTPASDVLIDVLRENPCNEFCCLYATALFITSWDLIESKKLLKDYDVVMGVSEYPIHPFKALTGNPLKPIWPELNSQMSNDFPYVQASNGSLYWAKTDKFLRHKTFYQESLIGYITKSIDIDTPQDYERCLKSA